MRRTALQMLVTGSLLLALVGTAQAATIIAGPLRSADPVNARCEIFNGGPTTQNMTLTLYVDGVASGGTAGVTPLAPYNTFGTGDPISANEPAACVAVGNTSALRLTLCLTEPVSGRQVCVQGF